MKGRANFIEGLGFIDTAIIDSHFVNRGRFGRLAVAVAENISMMGIGISEDTAVIITEGRYLEFWRFLILIGGGIASFIASFFIFRNKDILI
jgi:cyanophycinase-like exopeptidase